MSKRILVTGGAGFIGFHLCKRLLEDGWYVISVDNINDYYDRKLKIDRLTILKDYPSFSFHKLDLADRQELEKMYAKEKISDEDYVVNLAAQAGVRYALQNPDSYIKSNINGFFNLLELSRKAKCRHLIYASSSSVYGGNTRLPFSVSDNVDHPISLYAATKKSNELMAHVYSYTYNLPTTGLRFFTVYGPWGRPDMSLFIFTRAILEGKPLPVFNHGDMYRDFTYIDDVVEGVVRVIDNVPAPDSSWDSDNPDPSASWVPYRLYNIGNHQSVHLLEFIWIIEEALDRKAKLEMKPMMVGDVKATFADIDHISTAVGFKPKTSIREGIAKFMDWYREYYGVS